MDFRARDNTWLAQLDELSSGGGLAVPDSDLKLRESVIKFKALIKRRTRIWWNRAFLTKYIEKALIPWGLRIHTFPSYKIEDEAFKDRWEALADTCSLGFLNLLKEKDEKSLLDLESEIDTLQGQLKRDLSSDEIKRLSDGVDTECQKLVKEIQTVKTKKFNRDTQDRLTHRMYRWRSPMENMRPRSRNNSYQHSRSASIASGTSNESLTSTTNVDPQGCPSSQIVERIQTRPDNRRKRRTPYQVGW
ncbi:uncharacterized protein [Phyllobates terribilis]|uniref:uncharacterized protein n=1 Tax=Phyllobates terribilis TaxID=111132 RepID=UPI003CCAFCDC